ncbi:protein of unknown function DUF1130 [Gloeomargarita lithophora Alchichica-D10]|uniref:DUF488 domain-containing protein n=1 Tax=Gloeomargarita lithophora Alchichica-D10 TaxID=1188229 RepID=A0A1J0ABV5_9CYAN|nr:DUF488 domain-containing protein [Gloeomargarita lithophora]APB33405.1 protein of unknown function DUF1130 [Gloeomargarita lithophora Alchichica-D10]
MIKLFTIGFTRKSAAQFFEGLKKVGVKMLIDTRLNNTSQLSGFAKQSDLRYFLDKITQISYEHCLPLAPTQDILDNYKKKKIAWDEYENSYLELIQKRQVESLLSPEQLDHACFLCSEDKPHYCHRRLAAEYLQSRLNNLQVIHL